MPSKLASALKSVDWNANVEKLCDDVAISDRIEKCNLRLAVWARQFENIEPNNSAIPFVREMQHGGHNVATAISLALYKPAASSMRSLLECALYYTYFRTHPTELASLVCDSKYYISKKDIIIFYGKHVRSFQDRQNLLNYSERLEAWYSETSAIVHGQVPGQWSNGFAVSDIKHDSAILEKSVAHFERAVALVQDTFLCVLSSEMWGFIESDAKEIICKGLPGPVKAAFKLDVA